MYKLYRPKQSHLIRALEVPCSNLDHESGYPTIPTENIHGFPQFLEVNAGILP